MANLRAIRNRIRSVKSTQKITKAMKMVAAARLRRAQEKVVQSTPYKLKIEELFVRLTQATTNHPLLQKREVQKRLVIVMASDRGLCGAFNSTLFRTVMRDLNKPNVHTEVMPVGKRAAGFFASKGMKIFDSQKMFWTGFDHTKSHELVQRLVELYMSKTFDQIDVYYNEFVSVMSQKPKLMTLIPIAPDASNQAAPANYIFKPDQATILNELVPKAIDIRFYVACLHSLAGEFGARMAAMDNATRNAGEMIDSLTLNMNRVRQAAITNELVEIISGASAIQ
ncbi:MAG: ATP synthase F1 subunit gamma [Bdellovibrionota bacterium]